MQHSGRLFISVVTLAMLTSALEARTAPSGAAMTIVQEPVAIAAIRDPVQHPSIDALETLLSDYEAIIENGGWPAMESGPPIRPPAPISEQAQAASEADGTVRAIVQPETYDPRIPTVRQILKIMGDYPFDDAATKDSDLYDIDLQEAVKSFQRRHGLEEDGIVGGQTQAAMSISPTFRIKQIIATIERIKQAPAASQRYIVVNIPEFRLRAYDDGQEVLESKVVVGTRKRATPVFSTRMTYVSFNPPWGVPVSIASEEMLPKIRKDLHYLKENNYKVYEIVDNARFEVDPALVPWESLSRKNFPYLIMQDPGDDNALGKIKFGLEKSDGIYLHDTASRKFFSRYMRALSHGCVRVEKPRDLAHYVFKHMEKYPLDKVDQLYDATKQKILKVDPVDVHFVYWTAWVHPETGRPQFRDDIYKKDAAVAETVLAQQAKPAPEISEEAF
jgi:L,D-transpeptidase YcbB